MATRTLKPHAATKAIRLTCQAPSSAQRVALVGEFNGWSRTAHPMRRKRDGSWEANLRLAPGRYEYKFLINDVEWLADPTAARSVANPFGNTNSVLEVG